MGTLQKPQLFVDTKIGRKVRKLKACRTTSPVDLALLAARFSLAFLGQNRAVYCVILYTDIE